MDCLEGMKRIADQSIDMVLCDLPYGITGNKWDTIIPFGPLWEQYERITKKDSAIVLSAGGVFTNKVVNSKPDYFRYKWIWVKNNATNPLNAQNRPMNSFEEILVFSKGNTANQSLNRMKYFPQGVLKFNTKSLENLTLFKMEKEKVGYQQGGTNYPQDVLYFHQDKNRFHPTQKPVQLFEYLVKTYTNKGDVVLDNCMGSGTTAIACINTERQYIGFETNKGYYAEAIKRIEGNITQLSLFA